MNLHSWVLLNLTRTPLAAGTARPLSDDAVLLCTNTLETALSDAVPLQKCDGSSAAS